MFLATLAAVHQPAKVCRGGFVDRPIIHVDIGGLKFTCSVEDARRLAADLQRAADESEPRASAFRPDPDPHNFRGVQKGNIDLVPAQHATLETPR